MLCIVRRFVFNAPFCEADRNNHFQLANSLKFVREIDPDVLPESALCPRHI